MSCWFHALAKAAASSPAISDSLTLTPTSRPLAAGHLDPARSGLTAPMRDIQAAMRGSRWQGAGTAISLTVIDDLIRRDHPIMTTTGTGKGPALADPP
jgi:hypothetical protein